MVRVKYNENNWCRKCDVSYPKPPPRKDLSLSMRDGPKCPTCHMPVRMTGHRRMSDRPFKRY